MAGGIYAQLSARERMVAGLLLTEGRRVMSNEVSCDSVARRINGENPLDVLVGVSTPYGPLLTDDYGRPIRFAEYGDGPCRFGDRPIQVMKPFCYQPCDRLRCVCSTNPQKGLGVFHVWTERGSTYQAVLGPCAYERRPEKTLTLPDELWSRNESWMRDFFEQETSDFLCLGVVSRRTYFGLVGGNSARG